MSKQASKHICSLMPYKWVCDFVAFNMFVCVVFLCVQGSLDPPDMGEDKLRGYQWYLGKRSRIDAEQALLHMQDGVFLIRESDVRPGEYAIALK